MVSVAASRPRIDSSSRDSRWFSSAARACSTFMRSTMPTRSFSFASRRSMGSRSTLRVAVFAIAICDPRPDSDSLPLHRAVVTDQHGKYLVEALLGFGVGERAVGGLKRQPHRQADRALGDALALIAIKKRNAHQWRRRCGAGRLNGDRKSTRLNSSHLVISYAVFCLKKKKKK